MKQYRFGVIGFGGRGRHHMRTAEACPDVEARCVAVADSREPTPEEQARFGKRFYRDYRELLANAQDLDYVIIATPDSFHTEQALAALELGLTVYLEKAVAVTWEDAIRLYQTVMTKSYPLFIGYNLRRFPATLALKEILEQGQIGQVQAILAHVNTGNRWAGLVWEKYPEPPYSPLVLGKLTHDTDTIHHCLGAEAKTCVATAVRNYWPDREANKMKLGDTYGISGLLTNNVLYSIHFTTVGPDYERRYIVNGSEGQVEAVLHTSRPGAPQASVTLWRVGESPQEIPLTGTGEGGHGGADPRIHADFFAWLATQPTGPHEPRSILTGTMVPFAAIRSLQSGSTIAVDEMLAKAVGQEILV